MLILWGVFFGGRGACMKKKCFCRGGSGLNCLNIVCRFKREFGKRRGHVFEVWRGWDPYGHYELEEPSYLHKYPKQITLQHSIITNNINYDWHRVSQKS